MSSTDSLLDPTGSEVVILRQRVAELQRQLASFSGQGEQRSRNGVDVSISEREALLVEAERITHMGSWVWNVESNQVVWSDELFRILGFDPDRDQASVEAFFGAVHPEDRARMRTLSASSAQTGVMPRAEHRILRSDGSVRYVLTDGASLFDESGKLRRIIGTILDVTEARESERRLAYANTLLEEAQALGQLGSWALDLEHDKLTWSKEFCRILGVPEDTRATSEIFLARMHPDDRQALAELHQNVLRNAVSAQADARVVRASDEERFVRLTGVPHHDASGKPQQIRGTMLDLTEQRRLQERLTQAEKMEAIGRLAGGVAHDFNNLLMVVRGNLELMNAGDRPELRAIFAAVESAQTLTAGLLAFGRKANLQRQLLDLNQLVTETVTLLTRLVGEHIALRASTDVGLPAIDADRSAIQQALVNLVINARDALRDGGTITVRTHAVIDAGVQHAELSVEDDGPGIDAAIRERLFEPFFTTKPEGKGSGLGLAMVHGTVTQHGGSVRVDSLQGRGCRFTLRIPASPKHVSGLLPTAASDSVAAPDSQRTILIVEDQPTVAEVLEKLLVLLGHRVLVAGHPTHALELAQQPRLDLVLCDLNMPEMPGAVLAAEIQRRRPGLPVLFMSGYSGGSAQVPANARVLGKPFSVAELHRAIEEAVLSVQTSPPTRSGLACER